MMRHLKTLVLVLVLFLMAPLAGHAGQINLYAAGSLKAALGDVAQAFEAATGNDVATEFAPSGLLRQRIEGGEEAHVFASANMAHPQTLVSKGQKGPVALFARNNLCALAQPGLSVATASLLDVLLDPAVRVGTSTPKADPSGDYAFELFAKTESIRAGSEDVLVAKALQLTGGPDSAKAPKRRNQYAWVMDENKADIFLTYCTNAVLAKKEVPELQIVSIGPELSVGADYGLIVLDNAPSEAWRLALFILSPEGQRILADYGFVVAGLPAKK
jgi:molybdate transport system substrate-binding protein